MRSPSAIDRLRQLNSPIEQICSIEGVPGVSVGVLHHGEQLWTENFGFRDNSKSKRPNADTQYGIGHLTMSMVSAGIGKLVDEGKLGWTTALKSIIPELDKNHIYWTRRATITDILGHCCGLDGEVASLLADGGNINTLPSLKALSKVVERIPRPLDFRERWLMCPWGHAIAGHIIEHISEQPLHQYLHEQLFRPLEMDSTTLRPSFEGNNNIAKPHSSLSNGEAHSLEFQPNFSNSLFESSRAAYSTVNDLLKWAKATLAASHSTEESANTVLKQIALILSNRIAMKNPSLLERSYGFGWARAQLPGVVGLLGGNSELWKMPEQPILGMGNESRLMIYHQGGGPGYSSFLALFPETQSAVVVLVNTTGISDAADWIARVLIEGLFDYANPTDYTKLAEEGKRRRLTRSAAIHNKLTKERIQGASPVSLECYVGKYINEEYEFMLEVSLNPDSESELMLSFQGVHFQRYHLRHYHYNVFEWSLSFDEAKKAGRYDVADPSYYKLRFELYPDNRACRIIWNIHDASIPHGLVFAWKDERLEENWRAVHDEILKVKNGNQLYLYLINQHAYSTTDARWKLIRRMREVLLKDVGLLGLPRPSEALFDITKVMSDEDADSSFSRKGWQCDDANHARGMEWLESIYAHNTDGLFELFNKHPDFSFLLADITYGLLLSDRQVLDDVDTELVVLPAVMGQDMPRMTYWHIRGIRRLGISKKDVQMVMDCVQLVVQACGVTLTQAPTVDAVDADL